MAKFSDSFALIAAVFAATACLACTRAQAQAIQAEVDMSGRATSSSIEVGRLTFDLQPMPVTTTAPGASSWLATYTRDGKTATFGIVLGPYAPSNGPTSVGLAHGRFVAESKSDDSILLPDLMRALEASKLPPKLRRVATLPFTFAVLGDHQSRSSGGSFSSDPPGDWLALKIFVADGNGEFYMNLDPPAGRGDITEEDPSYGDIDIAELAKVL